MNENPINISTIEIYKKLSGPLMVSWDITNKCNMFCKHCFNDSNKKNEIELDNHYVEKILRSLIEIRPNAICLCGGEPLVKKEIENIITVLYENRLNFSMVTNGLLLNEKRIKFLSGKINFMQISLDGANKGTHDKFRNSKGAFEHVVNVLGLSIENKINTAVSFCPNKKNYKEFVKYVKLIDSIGCRSIRMMQFIPQARGLENSDLIMSPLEEYEFQWMLREARKRYPHINIEYGDPLEHIFSYIMQGIDNPIVEIRPNGDFAISPYLPIIFGNIKKSSLKEAWNNELKNAWRNRKVHEFCANIKNISDLSKFKNPWKDIIAL